MKPDVYTKTILTIIAMMLTVIACNQYVNPAATVSAQTSQLAGVQFSINRPADTISFFDTRTGELWNYDLRNGNMLGMNGNALGRWKLTALGQPLLGLKH